MTADEPRVVLVTGASSGIGLACAEAFFKRGYKVFGTSRAEPAASSFTWMPMDVTDDASVTSAVERVLGVEGRIDVLINNAGYGISGAVEDTGMDEARRQFETNFWGYVRLINAVLPSMRERRRGTIVNVSSIAGVISVPFQAYYSASKFAIEGLSEALWYEVAPFGVRVMLIEPGDYHTGFTSKRQRTAATTDASPYRESFERALGIMEQSEERGGSPDHVAQFILRHVEGGSPRLRRTVGPLEQRLGIMLKRLLPERVFTFILRKTYKL